MCSCARVQDRGDEPARADIRLRHCLLRDGGGSGTIRVAGEARGVGAERFFLAGDFNMKLGMLGKEDEFVDYCGPCCWRSGKSNLESYGEQ